MAPGAREVPADAGSDDYRFDAVVIGAGVCGLAVARALALAGRATLLLEAGPAVGGGISSRSSEVIHAGIYYPAGSLKAALCVQGNRLLYEFAEQTGVPVRRTGKLLVAVTADEIAVLRSYRDKAARNGVGELTWLDQAEVRRMEPALHAVAGLFSPSTGIIDSHALMQRLLADFEQAGGLCVLNSPVTGGTLRGARWHLDIGGSAPCRVSASIVVNAAGLGAQAVARSLQNVPRQAIPELHLAVGQYYALSCPSPFRHLVYPVAPPGGLGVHLTLDLAGQARFGPDVRWRQDEDYGFDDSLAPLFYQAIRHYWPGLPDGALSPGYVGIRPKLYGPVRPDQDFMIQGPRQHGLPGLVNLFGIESPGLTSSLALAQYVKSLLL
ncbi:NAD(P)/FAD-dependent oxidoreductase [Pseudoduganella armeniaca]|uniref:FAD-dependent oxidoreductase n=1 Tax=Pseudoduganella armeniaca TaxID=2072590 RepID=A0A2R4CGX5_9BURK|nr:NAD(P)/FAD-dependent oxidoreductase [Pseudoduganella armeniaca]AVR98909.1 FAD-dependent oxidoreductase [Pseudoduganella armeniaca]